MLADKYMPPEYQYFYSDSYAHYGRQWKLRRKLMYRLTFGIHKYVHK